jgi:ElaB/YqjD/DUF883 family membrane-anchored ribosome-binding protein
MPKIRVFKSHYHYASSYDEGFNTISHGVADWCELTDEELQKLNQAIRWANTHKKQSRSNTTFFVIEQCENDFTDLYKDAKEMLKCYEESILRDKQKAEALKKKKEESALERKRKQLEKLKKELGEKE